MNADEITALLKDPRPMTANEWASMRWWLRQQITHLSDPNVSVAQAAKESGLIPSLSAARRTTIRVNGKVCRDPSSPIPWVDDWASLRTGKTMMNVAVVTLAGM